VANVTVGVNPTSIVYDSTVYQIFVAAVGANEVDIVSASNNTVVGPIQVGNYALGLAYDPAKGEIFNANTNDNSVVVLLDTSESIVTTVQFPIGTYPYGLAYNSASGEILVANEGTTNLVAVISDSTNAVVANVTAGNTPQFLAYDSANSEIFATNKGSNTVSVISESAIASASPSPAASPTSSSTASPSPSPTVPEFGGATLVSLVAAILVVTVFAVAMTKKARKASV